MLIKEHNAISLDSKGRLRLSKTERAQFREKVVITTNADYFLFLTEEEWNQRIAERLAGLKGVELQRAQCFLFSSAFLEEIDGGGRVLIPAGLRRKTKIQETVWEISDGVFFVALQRRLKKEELERIQIEILGYFQQIGEFALAGKICRRKNISYFRISSPNPRLGLKRAVELGLDKGLKVLSKT